MSNPVYDSTGHGHDGTQTSCLQGVTGLVVDDGDTAYDSNGVDSQIVVSDTSGFPVTAFSVEAWIYPGNTAQAGVLFDFRRGSDDSGTYLRLEAGDPVYGTSVTFGVLPRTSINPERLYAFASVVVTPGTITVEGAELLPSPNGFEQPTWSGGDWYIYPAELAGTLGTTAYYWSLTGPDGHLYEPSGNALYPWQPSYSWMGTPVALSVLQGTGWSRTTPDTGLGGFQLVLTDGVTAAAGPTVDLPALEFDGATGYGLAADTNLPVGNEKWSISLWVKTAQMDETSNGGLLVCWGTEDTGQRLLVHVAYGGYLTLDTFGSANYQFFVADDTWHHVALVHTGDGWVQFYLDGDLVGTPSLNVGPVLNGTFAIGGDPGRGNPRYFSGRLAGVQIYRQQLTAEQVATLAAGGSLIGPGTLQTVNAGTLFPATTYHVVATYDGSGSILYLNGEPANSVSFEASQLWLVGDETMQLLRDVVTGDALDAVVDEVAVYPRALTPEQVTNHWVTGGGELPPEPLALIFLGGRLDDRHSYNLDRLPRAIDTVAGMIDAVAIGGTATGQWTWDTGSLLGVCTFTGGPNTFTNMGVDVLVANADTTLGLAITGVANPVGDAIRTYRFDEGSGTVVNDVGSQSSPGVISGTCISWIAGPDGNGAVHNQGQWPGDGGRGRITLDGGGLPAGNSPRSFAFWLRVPVYPGRDWYSEILTCGSPPFFIEVLKSGHFGGDPGPTLLRVAGESYIDSTIDIEDGQWHHYVATWDGTAWRLYIDGELDNEVTPGVPLGTGTQYAYFFATPWEFDGCYYPVDLGCFRVFDRVLSVDEIAALFAGTAGQPRIRHTDTMTRHTLTLRGDHVMPNGYTLTGTNWHVIELNYRATGGAMNLELTDSVLDSYRNPRIEQNSPHLVRSTWNLHGVLLYGGGGGTYEDSTIAGTGTLQGWGSAVTWTILGECTFSAPLRQGNGNYLHTVTGDGTLHLIGSNGGVYGLVVDGATVSDESGVYAATGRVNVINGGTYISVNHSVAAAAMTSSNLTIAGGTGLTLGRVTMADTDNTILIETASVKSTASQNWATVGTLEIYDSATFDLNGYDATVYTVDLYDGVLVPGTGRVVVRGEIASGGTGRIADGTLVWDDDSSGGFNVYDGILTLSASIHDAADGVGFKNFAKHGDGTLVLAGTGNDWRGTTNLFRGTTQLGVANGLPYGSLSHVPHVDIPGGSGLATFDLNGFDQSLWDLQSNGYGVVTNSSPTPATLSVCPSIDQDAASQMQYQGNLRLAKLGTSLYTFSVCNNPPNQFCDFTGGLYVEAGQFRLYGSGAMPSVTQVSLGSGATFDLNNQTDTIQSMAAASDAVITGPGTLCLLAPSVDQSVGGNWQSCKMVLDKLETVVFAFTLEQPTRSGLTVQSDDDTVVVLAMGANLTVNVIAGSLGGTVTKNGFTLTQTGAGLHDYTILP